MSETYCRAMTFAFTGTAGSAPWRPGGNLGTTGSQNSRLAATWAVACDLGHEMVVIGFRYQRCSQQASSSAYDRSAALAGLRQLHDKINCWDARTRRNNTINIGWALGS